MHRPWRKFILLHHSLWTLITLGFKVAATRFTYAAIGLRNELQNQGCTTILNLKKIPLGVAIATLLCHINKYGCWVKRQHKVKLLVGFVWLAGLCWWDPIETPHQRGSYSTWCMEEVSEMKGNHDRKLMTDPLNLVSYSESCYRHARFHCHHCNRYFKLARLICVQTSQG